MSLRKLQLFDRKPVNTSPVQEIVSKIAVSIASPDGSVWIGTSDGRLCRFDVSFALLSSVAAFPSNRPVLALRCSKQAVLALGRLSEDRSARLCAYHLFRTGDNGNPALIGSVRIPPEMEATCIDLSLDFSYLVVGCSKGQTLIYSGATFGRPGVKPMILVPDDPSPVSGVRIVGSNKLFIVTEKEVTSVALLENSAAVVVYTDTSQSPLVSGAEKITVYNEILLLAKPEAIFGFSHDQGNVSASSLVESKDVDLIDAWRQYLLLYAAGELSIVANYPSNVSGETRFVACSFSVVGAVLGVCPSAFDGHSVLLFTQVNDGEVNVSILREKPMNEQLEALCQKFLFEWAIDVATFENLPKTVVTELYRRFADHHFEKDEFEKSMTVLLRALEAGLPLETSYAINKFLIDGNGARNSQKLNQVAEYLFKVHTAPGNVLKLEHTTLLLLILESLGQKAQIDKVFDMVSESVLLDLCSVTPAFIDQVSDQTLARAFTASGRRCLELLAQTQRFHRARHLLEFSGKENVAEIIKSSSIVKSCVINDRSLIDVLSDPCDFAHASFCHSRQVPPISTMTDSVSPDFLKLLLELTLRVKGNSRDIVRTMINRGMAHEALLLCKQFGAPCNAILPICASLNAPFDALAYPAMSLEDVVSNIPSNESIAHFALAVARRSNIKSEEVKVSNSDEVPVAVLIETADVGSCFGAIKGALLGEFKKIEQITQDRESRAENDALEVTRMKNEISLLKRKPIIHNLGRPCALCKVPISEFPITLFKCMHAFHQQCALDWVECRICGLESRQHREILTQRKQAVHRHDEMFKCMAGNKGARFEVAISYLGHGLFSH